MGNWGYNPCYNPYKWGDGPQLITGCWAHVVVVSLPNVSSPEGYSRYSSDQMKISNKSLVVWDILRVGLCSVSTGSKALSWESSRPLKD